MKELSDYTVLVVDDTEASVDILVEATRTIRNMEAKSEMKRVPIVAATANAVKGDRERFLAAGMDDYIAKPIKRNALEEVIGKVVG